MGSHPNLNNLNHPATAENSQANPILGPVLGSQTVNLPNNDYSRPLAMPIYIGSTPVAPTTMQETPKVSPQVFMPPSMAPLVKAQQVQAPTPKPIANGLPPLPVVDSLPTPPWMLFKQNVVRVPQAMPVVQNTPPALPNQGNAMPTMGSTANQGLFYPQSLMQPQQQQGPQTNPVIPPQMPSQAAAQPQQGALLPTANPTQVPPTTPNGNNPNGGAAANQVPQQQPTEQPKQQPEPKPPKPDEAKRAEEAKKATASSIEDDAMNQDTIRSLNSRMNNSVQSVRVAAAGDFLTLMVANPDLTNNPRYHEIVDAFMEKMLKDPSGDVRAAAYRSMESANITKVSQGVYDLLKQRSENDGVFGVETDSINTILASVSVESPPEPDKKDSKKAEPNKKEIHKEARKQEKAEQKQEKQAKEDAHNGKVPAKKPVQPTEGKQDDYGLAS